MQFALFLCGLMSLALAGPVSYQVDGKVTVSNLTRATENDVTYYLYNRKSNEGLFTHINDLPNDHHIKQVFATKRPTLILIHGWDDDNTADSNGYVKNAILGIYDVNVVVVDWSPLAGQLYINAHRAVRTVGEYVGHFIQVLSTLYNYPLHNFTVVGFSLGAHIAGCAGAYLDGELPKIVGLDPAGPLFSSTDLDSIVDKTDAQYVQIIHTNGRLLGMADSVGHSDFFPQGGRTQPGCGADRLGACSHNKAWAYYRESILNNDFVSQRCDSYESYTSGTCTGRTAYMGGFYLDTTAIGDFYLDVNGDSPFGRG